MMRKLFIALTAFALMLLRVEALAEAQPDAEACLIADHYVDVYGYNRDAVCAAVRDASGNILAKEELVSWETSMLSNGAGVTANLYALENDRYYAEGYLIWEGITAKYLLFTVENGAIVPVICAVDPGNSSGQTLMDGIAGETLNETEFEFDTESMLSALNAHFAGAGITFSLRPLDFGPDRGGITTYAANLPESQRLAAAVVAVREEEPAEQAQAASVVRATSSVNIRSQASVDSEIWGVLTSGETAEYLFKQQTDERGVIWYHIRYSGIEGWVSSKYAVIE